MPQMIDVCPLSELEPGEMRLVEYDNVEIGVFNCDGEFYAIEDRCSHDDGPLAEGDARRRRRARSSARATGRSST